MEKNRRKKLQAELDQCHGYRGYEDDDIEVRPVKDCGFGLFAKRQFRPGEIILEVTGQWHRESEYAGSHYVMDLGGGKMLEPGIPACFANHSCNPNCELTQLEVGKETVLVMVALCNIEPDTELVYDYQWDAGDHVLACHCGAADCRGWIVEAGQLEKQKKLIRKASAAQNGKNGKAKDRTSKPKIKKS